VVFDRENDGEFRKCKSVLFNRFNDVNKTDLARDGVAVIDERCPNIFLGSLIFIDVIDPGN